MKSSVIGVILAALAFFFWGFLYWAASPLPYKSWKKPTDFDAASEALRKYFPENGTYFIPDINQDPELLEKSSMQGPVAFVSMIAHDGKPTMDPKVLLKGFILNLLTCALLALVLAATALPEYKKRAGLILLIGVIAALSIHLGDAIWWGSSLNWKIFGIMYEIGGFTLAGLVLAKFVKPKGYLDKG